ncbi:hypothetical protein K461DRAFT_273713 [Myriangium duriaei CBS 260.36]|uniref:Uncharacterized protein n=1 Tax=Myriangium duriaei CBS 260.36 TaxID=1168546 RepID=A0A9P4J8Y4_9PEZI|nr:hypothetical protein K461DRAFT_273713 [Myriangium duriaei CBS 260.36]
MLDENLPAFFYKKSSDGIAHHDAIYLAYHGSDPSPAYILKHADPSKHASRNCYAAALFDSFNPDVLYGEVLVQPTWTQPSLSEEEIRRNGGVPPPPQAIIPGEFSIQLYEPDQQITVRRKPGGLSSSTTYEFDMPQTSFRTPSVSALDRTQSDPAATATTPKLNFVWRKESKLSKDLTCFLTGKSTDGLTKRKHKDPDIAIAHFRSLREVTIYEPNLSRVELEDLKGLEVVVLLAAATIKDIYLSNNLKEIFNISDAPARKLSSGGRKVVPTPSQAPSQPKPPQNKWVPTTVNPNLAQKPQQNPQRPSAPQTTGKDPRAQWDIDAETARLKAQVAAEEKEAARRTAQHRRDKEKADEAETRRLRKMVEAETKEAKRKQKQIDDETDRLRRKYGQNLPQLPSRPSGGPQQPRPPAQRPSGGSSYLQPIPQGAPVRPVSSNGMYAHPNPSAYGPSGFVMSGGAGPSAGPPGPRPKKSGFFGLRELEDEMRKVTKKRSSLW